MDFDLDVQIPSLEELVSRHTLTSSEHEDVSEAGARQFKVGINESIRMIAKETGGSKARTVNGVTYRNLKQHFSGLENNLIIVPTNGENMGVAFNGYNSYYWRFVENGHFVVDNRKKFKGGRKYKYRLKTINNGNRNFRGLHFVDTGIETSKEDAVNDMKKKFISIIKSKGG